ncbi:unnamed protein product [Rangifer tarandus platyrhynchus]|uniref:Uncharacterized protein n=2 Tax=Rangifer tarandus platyrhynchus TaxID=3082113 RepID=A0ABN8YW48_RANTA|nr:unnamed protein product [Rangifer tarandus platyrhynchus]CAI9700380.1 unnamed protein product [Rangifer tarandus platyrhynchus]
MYGCDVPPGQPGPGDAWQQQAIRHTSGPRSCPAWRACPLRRGVLAPNTPQVPAALPRSPHPPPAHPPGGSRLLPMAQEHFRGTRDRRKRFLLQRCSALVWQLQEGRPKTQWSSLYLDPSSESLLH